MFKRKPKAPSETEFRGPLDLFPGDRVLYYQQEFTLAGVIFLVSGKERRCQYHFLDADGMHAVIAFEPGSDPRITLERAIPDEEHPDLSGETLTFEDEEFQLESESDPTAFCLGGVPAEKGARATCRVFADEDEMEFVTVEDWDGYVEMRKGESIHENELVVKRQRDEEDWEIKPPPRIDLRSLNEARRTKVLEVDARAEKAQEADLAGARAKLAAFRDDGFEEEGEDIVALSEIVDVRQRFEDDEPRESPPDEKFEEPPAPAPVPATTPGDDPFSSVFEEGEIERRAGRNPVPDLPEPDEDEEEEEPVEDSAPLFPAEASPAAFITDHESDDFLSAGIFGDDEDDEIGR